MYNYKRKKYQNDSPTLSQKRVGWKKNLSEKIKVKDEHEHMNKFEKDKITD